MPVATGTGRFERQVRLVLMLIVVFLAVLDFLNVVLLTRARDDAERAERERAKARGREVARVIGPDVLAAREASRFTPGQLARLALSFDLSRVALWDDASRERVASREAPAYAARVATLDAEQIEALRAGRAVASDMLPRAGGEGAVIGAFIPVLDSSGRLAAVVEIQQTVPELGALQQTFRLLVATQAAGVVLIAVLVLFFGRWVSRPYRTLAAVAGEAGIAAQGTGLSSDPEDLAAAFRAVADKLREQESALEAMGGGHGGLADLVGFVSGAARGMTTGVMVVERHGRMAGANPAAEALLGLPPGGARGLAVSAMGPGAETLREPVRACLEEGRSVSREVLEIRPESGRGGHIGVTISPVAGIKGDIQGALVLMTDLTEIRQVQEQVRLRENLAAVGELSAGIAHEFRNALGTILGYAKMLEKRDDPRVHGPAREILKEVDAVKAQIDEFLLYARPPEPQRTPVDLEALVRGCASTAPSGISVEVSGDYATVLGDEGLLKRVVGNLLQNAADVAAEAGRPLHVRISGRKAARTLQVEVEDDGPGIPAERRGRVFVPFFTTRARGTGLGLALVQRTMVDLGGSVEVGEGPRGGASFRLRFPFASPSPPSVTNRDGLSRSAESGRSPSRASES